MDDPGQILPVLIPIGVLHAALAIWGLADILGRQDVITLGKAIWAAVIIGIVLTGPLIYFMYGRGEKSWVRRVAALQEEMRRQSAQPSDPDEKGESGKRRGE